MSIPLRGREQLPEGEKKQGFHQKTKKKKKKKKQKKTKKPEGEPPGYHTYKPKRKKGGGK